MRLRPCAASVRRRCSVSRNACSWCGTEVEDERQHESALCVECYADAQASVLEEIGVEEMRNNEAL